jgi:hypothetical protein
LGKFQFSILLNFEDLNLLFFFLLHTIRHMHPKKLKGLSLGFQIFEYLSFEFQCSAFQCSASVSVFCFEGP